MAEWTNATDSRSVPCRGYTGSNPVGGIMNNSLQRFGVAIIADVIIISVLQVLFPIFMASSIGIILSFLLGLVIGFVSITY